LDQSNFKFGKIENDVATGKNAWCACGGQNQPEGMGGQPPSPKPSPPLTATTMPKQALLPFLFFAPEILPSHPPLLPPKTGHSADSQKAVTTRLMRLLFAIRMASLP
jgi:hypothetical protein